MCCFSPRPLVLGAGGAGAVSARAAGFVLCPSVPHLRRRRRLIFHRKAQHPALAQPRLPFPGLAMSTPFPCWVSALGVPGLSAGRCCSHAAGDSARCCRPCAPPPAPPPLPSQALSAAPGAASGGQGWTSPPWHCRSPAQPQVRGRRTPRAAAGLGHTWGRGVAGGAGPSSGTHGGQEPGCWHCCG